MHPPSVRPAGELFNELVEIMARLRAPNGCPWDLEQSFDTIKPYTLEETYEVLDAIERRDWPNLAEELGDFMLQAVFYAQMADEAGHFRIEDALRHIVQKLIRRHPHVFGTGDAKTSDDVLRKWNDIKDEEKKDKPPQLILDGVPRALPALMEAAQISAKAARTGFDWPDVDGALEKVAEEAGELARARESASKDEIESELGDLLFTLVNVARFLKVDPEQALRKTNARFRKRFGHIETSLASEGRRFSDATLEQMEALWQQAKGLE
ncbi:MAG: nucleoside triphosphate pyrophosphohydrolase [Bryobacteraceae bacterium]|nr:nucleoside triphosphate pyrophosphohydrolase [Bryobacteraceae bacterium]